MGEGSFHPKRSWTLASLHNGTVQLWDYSPGSITGGAKEQFSNIKKGIGMETTRALAQTGRFSKVYLTSRNPDNGLAALEEVRKTIQIPDMVEHHQLDITDRWSIEEFKVSF